MSRCIVRTYKVPVPRDLYSLCSELNRVAARIYNKTMSLVKKIKSKKGFWLSPGAAQKYILCWSSTINIHTHSKQAMAQQYFQALDSYFNATKTKPYLKPPYKKKNFMPFIWKNTAIKLIPDRKIRLSMGNNQEPIIIQTTLPADTKIRQAKLVYEEGRYYLHLGIEVKNEYKKNQDKKVMSVDPGILRPNKSIDAIITDPPYGLSKKDIMNDNDLSAFYEMLPECYRVLKDDSFFITFFSTKHLPDLFKQNPFTYFWQIVLYCPEGRVNSPIGFTKYMSCFVFTKGSPKIVQRAKDIFVDTPGKMVEPDEGYIDHPTPKPKHFIKELLKMFTKEGELILDPFVGSGSVSLACYQMNRNFIAFEIKKEYCLLAYKRLENSFKPQLKWQDTLWSK